MPSSRLNLVLILLSAAVIVLVILIGLDARNREPFRIGTRRRCDGEIQWFQGCQRNSFGVCMQTGACIPYDGGVGRRVTRRCSACAPR